MTRLMQSADNNKIQGTKRLVLCALLCAAALTIFVVEAQIPLPIPFPGVKFGLSNVITLFALVWLGTKDAFLILICRIILGAIFISNPSVLIYSLSAGLVCLAIEAILLKFIGKNYICEISIIGAIVHNAVQVACAAAITKTASVFAYLPPLIIVAIITGAFCGLCVKFTYKKFFK